jgi:multimeric flavodoxin WrbA
MLNGSARNKGNTNYLLSLIKDKLNEKVETELINISDYKINYCLGCHKCEENRLCIQNDDVNIIHSKIQNSNFLLIASPSY